MGLKHKNIIDVLQNNQTNRVSIFSHKSSQYSDLHLFRNQLEADTLGPNHRPYTAHKKKVRAYQSIFISIGLLYAVLGTALYLKSFTWTYSFLFGEFSIGVKSLVCILCVMASFGMLGLGFAMRPEKEATQNLYNKAKLRLKQAYKRKMTQFGVHRYLAVGEERNKFHSFRQMYEESLEKLQEQKEDAAHLLERISKSDSLDRQRKEHLFNQAILEMYDRMTLVVDTFRTANHKRLLSFPSTS